MKAAIHQPEHLPWRGFLRKMQMADVFVVLDDVQFAKNNRQNRNQIVSRAGDAQWVTVPVISKGRLAGELSTTTIAEGQPWQQTYLGRIRTAYGDYPFFNDLFEEIEQQIVSASDRLLDLNLDLLDVLRRRLEITTPIIRSSELAVKGLKSDRLVSILCEVRADTYIAGSGSRAYMDLGLFETAGIEVIFNDYAPPTYDAANGYIPGVSAVDLLFAHGPEARAWL